MEGFAQPQDTLANRDPVLDLSESAVQQVVDGLSKKHLVMEKSGFGSAANASSKSPRFSVDCSSLQPSGGIQGRAGCGPQLNHAPTSAGQLDDMCAILP